MNDARNDPSSRRLVVVFDFEAATSGSAPALPDREPYLVDARPAWRAFGRLLIHREQDLWVANAENQRRLQDLIRDRLLAERFDIDDAEEWAYRYWSMWLDRLQSLDESTGREHIDARLAETVVTVALEYRATGMPVDEAFGWANRSLSASYAVHIRNNGWNPDTYTALTTLCLEGAADGDPNWVDDTDQWIDAPIAWWRALRYLQTGFSVEEALDHEARRLGGEDVDAAMDVLLGLNAGGTS